MRDLSIWSLNLGRWGWLRVRVHASFIFLAVLVIHFVRQTGGTDHLWVGVLGIAILFASVVFHEVFQCYAAARIGGRTNQIVIGPLAGMGHDTVPHDPTYQRVVALAGPTANALLVIFISLVTFVVGDVPVRGLLNPIAPASFFPDAGAAINARLVGETALKLGFWINWVLFLINILPAFPLDGGRILCSALWPTLGYRTAVIWVVRSARLTAVALCALAWISVSWFPETVIVAWVPLVLIAAYVFFMARREIDRLDTKDSDHELLGYDFSYDYSNLSDDLDDDLDDDIGDDLGDGHLIERWRERRRDQRIRQAREQEEAEEEEEARVDMILERLYEGGLDALSIEDRELLNRVSARYRYRLRNEA